MDIWFYISLFVIGFLGSFVSGMLGIGGSIINYPMLLYIPPLLGFLALSPHEVSGITAVQVFFATLAGALAYRKGGYLNKSLILYMGLSILAGSFIGGFGSGNFSEEAIQMVYGVLAVLAAILLFIPRKDQSQNEIVYNKFLAIILSFVVGLAAGVVGAGGAFLIVPIMLTVLKIPMRVTIATSLAITFLSSIGATFGKIITGQILFVPAAIMVIASLIAAPIGAKVGQRANTKILQGILAVLIVITAVKIWWDIIL